MGTNYFKPHLFVVFYLLGWTSLPKQAATGKLLLRTQTCRFHHDPKTEWGEPICKFSVTTTLPTKHDVRFWQLPLKKLTSDWTLREKFIRSWVTWCWQERWEYHWHVNNLSDAGGLYVLLSETLGLGQVYRLITAQSGGSETWYTNTPAIW